MMHLNLLIVLVILVTLTNAAPAAPTLPKCGWIGPLKYTPAGCRSTYILEGRDWAPKGYLAKTVTLKSTGNKTDDANACFEHARSVNQYGAVMEVGTVEPGHFKCIAKAFPKMESDSLFGTFRPNIATLPNGATFQSYELLGQYQIPGQVVRVAFDPIRVDLEKFKAMECDILSFYSHPIPWTMEQTVWCKKFDKSENRTLILGEDCNHCRW